MGKIRKTNSKYKIEQAFIKLLAAKDYDQISISNLTKVAQINRGTFYLNYLDKDDLRTSIEDNFFSGIEAILANNIKTTTNYFSNETIEKIAYYLKDNYHLTYALLASDLSAETKQKFTDLLKKSFLKENANLTSPAIPAPYAKEVIFSSIISIFSLWIKREMKESIPQLLEIAQKYSELSPKDIFAL